MNKPKEMINLGFLFSIRSKICEILEKEWSQGMTKPKWLEKFYNWIDPFYYIKQVIRKFWESVPMMISEEIIGTKSMDGPPGLVFYLDYINEITVYNNFKY